jgi:hypothetical protein
MSKEAALRAMREAAYAARTAGPAAAAKAAKPVLRPTAAKAATSAPPADAEGLCGHRSMNGRSCTREHGHAAKSHRYS